MRKYVVLYICILLFGLFNIWEYFTTLHIPAKKNESLQQHSLKYDSDSIHFDSPHGEVSTEQNRSKYRRDKVEKVQVTCLTTIILS